MDGSGADKYAEVILKSGVNLAEGQPLLLRADPANRWFAEVNYPAIDFSVQYVIVMYCSFYDIMDPLNGKQMFIKSISASWYC